MTLTDRFSGSALRLLAVLGAMAMVFALLPQTAGAQDPPDDPDDACPEDAPESDFTDREDIPPVHRENVDCAAHFDIVQGFADNTYRPRLQVRRDQMASFIALTLDAAGVALPAADEDAFTDVGEGNVHADNINRLAAAGIVEGGPLDLGPDEYGPALRTRRDQMASFLMRAAGFALEDDVNAFDSTTQQFSDVPSGNVHFAKVNAAAENNIAQGVGGGQYDPRDETRRDQMASFVVRLLNFILDDGGPPPPVGPGLDLALDPAECVVGEEITATATAIDEDEAGVQDVDVEFETSGLVADPVTGTGTTDAEGAATFAFTPTEAGDLTVTVTGTIDGEEFTDTVTVNCPEPQAPEGPITLADTTVQRGGTLSGTVTDPGTVASITATGCGLNNEPVAVSGSGTISVLIPASASAGDCTLTFTVQRTNGTVETQTFTITVSDLAPALTEGPDLLSAEVEENPDPAATNVIYTFDEDATGFASNPNDFHLYDGDGTRVTATDANLVAGNPNQIRARFLTTEVNTATLATVNIAAVTDAAGNINYWSGVPLFGFEFEAGVTNAPDLVSVSNIVRGAVNPLELTADFRFDEAVDETSYAGFEEGFRLISRDNTTYFGLAAENVSADDRTVRVTFETLVQIPVGSIVRGVVESGTVADSAGNFNPLQAADIVDDGTNDAPSLVSATVVGTDQVDYLFSEPVDAGILDAPDPNLFYVYDRAGIETAADTAVRSTTNTRLVRATFPDGTIATAVGASVDCANFNPGSPAPSECDDGAVFGNQNNAYNSEDEVPLQGLVFQAGQTALPDLVSVTAEVDQFGNTRVVYTFDDDLEAVYGTVADVDDFVLVDEFSTIFFPAVAGEVIDNRAIFDDNEFTPDQVRDAVVGSVNHGDGDTGLETASFGVGGVPVFPEGHVPVTETG